MAFSSKVVTGSPRKLGRKLGRKRAGVETRACSALGSLIKRDLEHDPEKWEPVFRKDHAQTKR
jgi:hypothetical protein